ncbi:MAG: FtsX-like permease family protein [Saprospiraceae bacterium]|nr:FtsX-like permease family protein [Saprospiraceae bacterium]
MNLPHFVARRIAFSRSKSFTKVIVRIAIAAIALSLATMIITTLIIGGFKKEISSKVFGFWGHIHITDTNINRTFEQIPISKSADYIDKIVEIEWLNYQVPVSVLGFEMIGKYKIKRTAGGVRHVQPFAWSAGIIKTKKEFGAVQLKGVDESFDWQYLPDFIVEGEPLDFNDENDNGLIVSKVMARALELKIGQRVQVSTLRENKELKRAFVIKGIYNTGLEEYDKKFAIADLRKIQGMLDWGSDEVSGIEVFLDEIEDLELVNEYIYNEILPARLYSETIRTKFPSIFEWLKLQDINEDLLLWLMLVVAIINMITALLILILERTHMIGLLKALGSTNWQIRKIFVYNAAYIILFGLLIGNILGLGICFLQDQTHFITLDEASYYLSYAPVQFNWFSILLVNVFCFFTTVVFLILPTYIVTSINPIKTLRFE